MIADPEVLERLCRANDITMLRIFGSAARGEASAESDIASDDHLDGQDLTHGHLDLRPFVEAAQPARILEVGLLSA